MVHCALPPWLCSYKPTLTPFTLHSFRDEPEMQAFRSRRPMPFQKHCFQPQKAVRLESKSCAVAR